MSKIIKSRTVGVLILMFLVGGIEGIRELISPEIFTFLMAGLTVLAGYFRVNPKVDF